MFCVYCGTENSDSASICVYCGQQAHKVQSQAEVAAAHMAAGGNAAAQAGQDSTRVPTSQPPAAAAVGSAPAMQAGAAIAVQKHPAGSPGQPQPAQSWFHVVLQKHPVSVYLAAAIVLLMAIMLWRWNSFRMEKTHRIEQLLKQASDSQAKSTAFTRQIQELRSRPATTMKDYYDQCLELESRLNNVSSETQKSAALVDQLIPEFRDDPKILLALNDMKKVLELDTRVQNDVRQETLLSKTLMHLEPSEQIEFYSMTIHSLQEEEKQLAIEEQQVVAQIHDEGRRLPSDLSRSLDQ
ncbi:MAG TPA: zinc ribbon domain-containing protein [Terriglobales bacterium]|jgi:hypothetical protein|nr:zinc ribbon domain-containing protein [Terriglobales bacterium]